MANIDRLAYEGLVQCVRDFGCRHFDRESVSRWCTDGGLPDEVVKDFVQLDFDGYAIIHKGANGSYDIEAQAIVLEELARISGATLPLSNDFLNLQIMEEFGDSQKVDYVRRRYCEEGRLAFALAISEPQAGSDTMGMETSVRATPEGLVLSGRKTFVNNGEYAPYILVAAIDDEAKGGRYPALSFWLVPHGEPGISVYPIQKAGQLMLPFSDVVLDEVKVEESWRLPSSHVGFPALFRLLQAGRLFACATALGLARAAMEDAVNHARVREAFGRSICEFQMVQQQLVDMEVKLRNMRAQVYDAAHLLSLDPSSEETRLAVALMKRYVPRAATEVASDALQILGGRGYTSQERVASIWEDCRGYQIAEGTDQIMVHIAAPLLMNSYAASEA